MCIAGDLSREYVIDLVHQKSAYFSCKRYLPSSSAALQSKNETDRFYDERSLQIHTLICTGVLLHLRVA